MTSTDSTAETPVGTPPVAEHSWLKQLIGTWSTESEMIVGPDQPPVVGRGTEDVIAFGDLWIFAEGVSTGPMGEMHYKNALGFDVSFKEYRGGWFCTMSSHLWKQVGEMSPDGRTLTLNCEGPHMEKDGEAALYRDVIQLIDENTRTMKSYGQNEDGSWHQFMSVTYKRI